MRVLRWLWALVLCACGAGAGVRSAAPDRAREPEVSAALRAVLARDAQRAEAAGAAAAELVASGAGIPGDSVGGFVDLPDDRCVLVLARGTAGVEDLDVFVYADDGTILASDEASERDASAIFCPPHPPRAYITGRIATGYGLVAVSAQELPAERASAVAAVFGTQTKSELPREIDSSWEGLDEQLAEHRRNIGGEWQSLRRVALPVDPRVFVRVSASVEANRCLDIYITPSDDVAYLELEVLDEEGRWIGAGVGRGRERSLIVCSPEKRQLTVQSRPHAGRGLAALVLSRSAEGAARLLAPSVTRYDLRPPGTLAEVRAAHAAELAREGFRPGVLVHQGRLTADRRASIPLSLAPGCARLDVLTAAPIRAVRAWLWSADGQLLAEDSQGAMATLFTCADTGRARLDVETDARSGELAVELRSTSAAPSVSMQNPLAAGRLLSLMQVRRSFRSLEALPPINAVTLANARVHRLEFRVPSAHCLEVLAALGADASGVEVRLFRTTDDERPFDDGDLGYGTDAASARLCAPPGVEAWPVTAELRANVGRGTALWSSRIWTPEKPRVDTAPQARD